MSFNIDEEYNKLIKVINNNAFDIKRFIMTNNLMIVNSPRINFLLKVLMLTNQYPQIELYLKDLLNYFTINELEKVTILHEMARHTYSISLNAFEIIINYGVNINIKNVVHNSVAHELIAHTYDNYDTCSIFNLFIKYNINLNILNVYKNTVLDVVTHSQDLNEQTKNCIMTLVDFGGKTNNPEHNEVYNFIQCYTCLTIKPAIKK